MPYVIVNEDSYVAAPQFGRITRIVARAWCFDIPADALPYRHKGDRVIDRDLVEDRAASLR